MTLGILLPLLLLGPMLSPRDYGFNINFGISKTSNNGGRNGNGKSNGSPPSTPVSNGQPPPTPAAGGDAPAEGGDAPANGGDASLRKRRSLSPFSMEDSFLLSNLVRRSRFRRQENPVYDIVNGTAPNGTLPSLQDKLIKNIMVTPEDTPAESSTVNEAAFSRNRMDTFIVSKITEARRINKDPSTPASATTPDLESPTDNKLKLEATMLDRTEVGEQQLRAENEKTGVSDLMKSSLSDSSVSRPTNSHLVTSDKAEWSMTNSETEISLFTEFETVKQETAVSDHVSDTLDTKDFLTSSSRYMAVVTDFITAVASNISEDSSDDSASVATSRKDLAEEDGETISVSEPDAEVTNIVAESSDDYITEEDSTVNRTVENPVISEEVPDPDGEENKIGDIVNRVDSKSISYQMRENDAERRKRAANVSYAFLPFHASEAHRWKRELELQGKKLDGENASLIILPLIFDLEDDRRDGDLIDERQQKSSIVASKSREKSTGMYYPLLYKMALKPNETNFPDTQIFESQSQYGEGSAEVEKENKKISKVKERIQNSDALIDVLKECCNKVSSIQKDQLDIHNLYDVLKELRKCLEEKMTPDNDEIELDSTFVNQDSNALDSSLLLSGNIPLQLNRESLPNISDQRSVSNIADVLDSQRILETLQTIFGSLVDAMNNNSKMDLQRLSRRKRLMGDTIISKNNDAIEIIEVHPDSLDQFLDNFPVQKHYSAIPEKSNTEPKSSEVSNSPLYFMSSSDLENITTDSQDFKAMTSTVEDQPAKNLDSRNKNEIKESTLHENVSSPKLTTHIGGVKAETGYTDENERTISSSVVFTSRTDENIKDSRAGRLISEATEENGHTISGNAVFTSRIDETINDSTEGELISEATEENGHIISGNAVSTSRIDETINDSTEGELISEATEENGHTISGNAVSTSRTDETINDSTEEELISEATEENGHTIFGDAVFTSRKDETVENSREGKFISEETSFKNKLFKASTSNDSTALSEENLSVKVEDAAPSISKVEVINYSSEELLETTNFEYELSDDTTSTGTSRSSNEQNLSQKTVDTLPSSPKSETVKKSEAKFLLQTTSYEGTLSEASTLNDKNFGSFHEENLSPKSLDAVPLNSKSEIQDSKQGKIISEAESSWGDLSNLNSKAAGLSNEERKSAEIVNAGDNSTASPSKNAKPKMVLSPMDVENVFKDAASLKVIDPDMDDSQITNGRPILDNEESSASTIGDESLISEQHRDAPGDSSLDSDSTITEANGNQNTSFGEGVDAAKIDEERLPESMEPMNSAKPLEEEELVGEKRDTPKLAIPAL